MRITDVVTRVGDKGTTRLVGGQEIAKDDDRVEAYGTVDELNAVLGLARAFAARSGAPAADLARIDGILHRVQNHLFKLGGFLATLPEDRWEAMSRIEEDDIGLLERMVIDLNQDLPPLQEFVIPGAGPVSAFLHQGRTVCRRAERRVVALARVDTAAGGVSQRYLNRLSDLLFVLARWTGRTLGETERTWERNV